MTLEEQFEMFWAVYPRRMRRREAFREFSLALSEGAKFDLIVDGARKYAEWLAQKSRENWRPEAALPNTWLRAGRWEDEYALNLPQRPQDYVHVGETMSQAKQRWERQGKALQAVR